ncbi:hypothetical protein BMS3Bbin16_00649 [archaeon BMS3Bbin16]|nr:hypothetical protein BMS3Bbin16_00649 [archaeon BMS3Bbin16]
MSKDDETVIEKTISCNKKSGFSINIPKTWLSEYFGLTDVTRGCSDEKNCADCKYRSKKSGGEGIGLFLKPTRDQILITHRKPLNVERKRDRVIRYSNLNEINARIVLNDFKCSYLAGFEEISFIFKIRDTRDVSRCKELIDEIRDTYLQFFKEPRSSNSFEKNPVLSNLYEVEEFPSAKEVILGDGTIRWGVRILPREDEEELPMETTLESIFNTTECMLFALRDMFSGEDEFTPESFDVVDNHVDILWTTITRILIKKIYSMKFAVFMDENVFDSPVGLFYSEAEAKTLERLSDKCIPISEAYNRMKSDKILKELIDGHKKKFIDIVNSLINYLKLVRRYVFDLKNGITYEQLAETHLMCKQIMAEISEVEKIILDDLKKIDDKDKLTEGVKSVILLGQLLNEIARNINSLFAWRFTVRIEEIHG